MTDDFLFVKNDDPSYSMLKPGKASTSIRRHVMFQHHRIIASQKQRSIDVRNLPCDSRPLKPLLVRLRNKDENSTFVQKPVQAATFLLYNTCDTSRDLQWKSTLEPFNAMMQVDGDSYELIRFYIVWGNPQAGSKLRSEQRTDWPYMIIQLALSDKLHMLSLLSYIASMMDYLHLENVGQPRRARIMQKALEELQTRLRPQSDTSFELLYDVWCLFRAAEFQYDAHAASAHLKFIKHLMTTPDELQTLPFHLVKTINDVDLGEIFPGSTRPVSLLASEVRERMRMLTDAG
jgi:hypothetical protein